MQNNIADVLVEFAQEKKTFSKGNFIFYAGEKIEKMGIILKGSVQIEQNDFWGNRSILGWREALKSSRFRHTSLRNTHVLKEYHKDSTNQASFFC